MVVKEETDRYLYALYFECPENRSDAFLTVFYIELEGSMHSVVIIKSGILVTLEHS